MGKKSRYWPLHVGCRGGGNLTLGMLYCVCPYSVGNLDDGTRIVLFGQVQLASVDWETEKRLANN